MELGDRRLKVKKASIGITQVAGVEMGVNAMSMLAGTTSTDAEESRVLQLLNMVTPDELTADARIITRVNGVERQDDRIADVVFSPEELVAYVS